VREGVFPVRDALALGRASGFNVAAMAELMPAVAAAITTIFLKLRNEL
jgi:hypothetical protein